MRKKSSTNNRYTPEFNRDAVELVRSSGRTPTAVARDLGVSPESVRAWVNQAKTDRGEGAPGALTTAEREELVALRRRVRKVEQTNEILVKAAALFAQKAAK
uniref:transposase n=1 Tax=Streptomyces polyasparticus TaxID=2767826 RepID=UPI001BE430CF|nr:transposase [Streptomyces polyasparticus]